MISTFIKHQWKAFWRSKSSGKELGTRIVLWIFIAYLIINLLVLAFFLDKILDKVFVEYDVITAFNRCLLYYFLMDIVMRLQLQELPTLAVKPYLHLPVRKGQILSYLSWVSLFSAFNISPFLITGPFIAKVIYIRQGPAAAITMVVALAGVTLFNHFLAMWLKRKISLNGWILFLALAVIGAIFVMDYKFKWISIFALSQSIFGNILAMPVLVLLPLALALIMYFINRNYLKNNLYLDELHSNKAVSRSATNIPFLDRFGRVGDLCINEIKLILRNKRPKSALIMSFMFLFYGLLFYRPGSSFGGAGSIVFCGIFMTGIFVINYGQFMFGWQSTHFDGILTSKVGAEEFFKSKFLLFTIFSAIMFVFTIPYALLGWKYLYGHLMMFFWNMGINTVVVLWFATRNYKRIDLSKSASFNWEGVGASQFILGLPLLLGPLLIYFLIQFFTSPNIAMGVIGVLGLLGIFTRQYWIKVLVNEFNKKRYTIAEGFRNK